MRLLVILRPTSQFHCPIAFFAVFHRPNPSLIQAIIFSSTKSFVHSCNSSLSSFVQLSIRTLVPLGIRRFEALKPIMIKPSFPVFGLWTRNSTAIRLEAERVHKNISSFALFAYRSFWKLLYLFEFRQSYRQAPGVSFFIFFIEFYFF